MANKPPQRAKRPCKVSSCKDFAANGGYCDQHQDRIRKKDRERGTAHQRGYDAEWERERTKYLEEHPLCVDHKRRGFIEVATVVDHIIPHKGDKAFFWDKNNWQSLCESCHNRKTATEDKGGWSYQQTVTKANMQSMNKFEVGQLVLAASGYAIDSLGCKAVDQFTVESVDGKVIEVSDADGFVHRLHHSHFKAVTA